MSLYNIPNKRFFIFQSKSREHVCQLAGNKLVFKIIQKYCCPVKRRNATSSVLNPL